MTRRKAIWSAMFALVAAPAVAGFDTPTLCTGQMLWPNPDGTSETYGLEIAFDPPAYTIVSTHIRTSEVTRDAGSCTTYLQMPCRDDFEVDDSVIDDFYTFELRGMSDTSFFYTERWKGGGIGRTILTCRAR